jgi:excisionase family DNA binding protein
MPLKSPRVTRIKTLPRIFHTLPKAAELLQVNYWFLRDEIDRGNLIAHRFGNRFKISDADLENYIERARGARPQRRPTL